MSRRGDRWDSAPMGGFLGGTKAGLGDGRPSGTRQAAKDAVLGFVEGFCNRRRLHSSVGHRPPVDMEQIAAAA